MLLLVPQADCMNFMHSCTYAACFAFTSQREFHCVAANGASPTTQLDLPTGSAGHSTSSSDTAVTVAAAATANANAYSTSTAAAPLKTAEERAVYTLKKQIRASFVLKGAVQELSVAARRQSGGVLTVAATVQLLAEHSDSIKHSSKADAIAVNHLRHQLLHAAQHNVTSLSDAELLAQWSAEQHECVQRAETELKQVHTHTAYAVALVLIYQSTLACVSLANYCL
jgi:hypothetical protein